ncbi:MAG TPA: PilT/PilU family type 4a pilus ATPase [Pyrinomonadaceae bacterium]|jgi:twitching motility protein PilT
MEKLNEYLQTLLSTCSYELHLEPNKQPFVVAANGATDIANTPLLGTQISTMIFPLIPVNVRQELPSRPEVEFTHAHNLGDFSFLVKKSPSGFNVTIRPVLSQTNASPMLELEAPASSPIFNPPASQTVSYPTESNFSAFNQEAVSPAPETEPFSLFESSSLGQQQNADFAPATTFAPEIVFEEPQASFETDASQPQIEVVSVNDPEFVTTFSDTSDYEPPGPRGEFYPQAEAYDPPQNNFTQQQMSFSQPAFQSEPAFEQAQFAQPQQQPQQFVQPQQQQFVQPQQQFIAPPVQQFYAPQQEATPAAFVAASANPQAKAKMDAMFHQMAQLGASDLHLSVSMPPMIRKDGRMQVLQQGEGAITPDVMRQLLTSIMPAKNQEEFARRNDSDFAYEIPGLARFRANIFMDRKGMGGVFRIIPTKIMTAEQLGLSPAIMHLCELSKGLVVVTGPTGSGKSTTLCAMIDSINKRREDHIITIEDPIEFTHENQKCLVNQREVHNHTDSFKDALRAALREDPDILLVGEMRDLETIGIAIETAETGHLVFGTLHTTTAASTIDRIIDQFPADRQEQIRVMLSESLKGVIAQTLLPKKGGGRVAALEVLIVTPAISNLIREGKTYQIPSAMQTGKQHGMVMLNDALFGLVQKGLVEPVEAFIKAVDKANFEALLQRNGFRL